MAGATGGDARWRRGPRSLLADGGGRPEGRGPGIGWGGARTRSRTGFCREAQALHRERASPGGVQREDGQETPLGAAVHCTQGRGENRGQMDQTQRPSRPPRRLRLRHCGCHSRPAAMRKVQPATGRLSGRTRRRRRSCRRSLPRCAPLPVGHRPGPGAVIPTMSQRTRQGRGPWQLPWARPALTASRQPPSLLRSPGHAAPASIAGGASAGVETRRSGATLPPSRRSRQEPNAKQLAPQPGQGRALLGAGGGHSITARVSRPITLIRVRTAADIMMRSYLLNRGE